VNLLDLAARVEAAEGPERELDALIAVALKWELPGPQGAAPARLRMPSSSLDHERVEPGHYWLVQFSGMSLRSAPHFTASIDAALTLVPDRRSVTIERYSDGDGYAFVNNTLGSDSGNSTAAAPALALCAAALRARHAATAAPGTGPASVGAAAEGAGS
jgi:hypothetical protein